MRNTLTAIALSLGILSLASMAIAEDSKTPDQRAQMSGSMMHGDGMPGMMQMMRQMGPMMERCNEMMAAMTEHMKSAPHGSEMLEDNG